MNQHFSKSNDFVVTLKKWVIVSVHISKFTLFKNENDFSTIFLPEIVDNIECPMSILQSEFEKKLGIISTTIPINISVKYGINENIHIGSSCSVEEIQGPMSRIS